MNRRNRATAILSGLCLLCLCGVLAQHWQLIGLRASEQQLRAVSTPASETGPNSTSGIAVGDDKQTNSPQPAVVAPELLRLRNQVAMLTRQKKELASVAEENKRLRSQVASASANPAGAAAASPAFLRKTQARMAGYATPEATIESFLWAMQHQDSTNLLQAFAPEAVQRFPQGVPQETLDDFFVRSEIVPGLSIIGREEVSPGIVELKLQILPGLPPTSLQLKQIGQQWKITNSEQFFGH
jgi:hypothetical protein